MITLTDYTADELSTQLGIAPFQGRQLFRWLHGKNAASFDAMTDLPKALRTQLAECAVPRRLELVQMQESERTGTRKALLRLADGETVEAVLIRERDRRTICVSSQVGCALQCDFCATGLAGLTRNLSPGEIVEQALYLLGDEARDARTPNIVFMGMGEPFRNYDAVMRAIALFMDPGGLGIGARKITVSTAGEAKGIERFVDAPGQVRLSVSLHAANDALRDRLVPLNRRFPLARLRQAIDAYQAASGRQLTLEWTLLDGVNDTPEHAAELVAFIDRRKLFVNLIPWNPVVGIDYRPTPMPTAKRFRDVLVRAGVKATLRAEKGQDIDAACGQLRRTQGAA